MRWLALPVMMLVVACSSSEKPKNDLATADGGHSAKSPPPADGDPQGLPTPGAPEPIPDPPPPVDAGKDAPVDAALGIECTKLSACCDQLGAAGYDTSTCKSVLATKNDDACFAQYDRYKSYGDCS